MPGSLGVLVQAAESANSTQWTNDRPLSIAAEVVLISVSAIPYFENFITVIGDDRFERKHGKALYDRDRVGTCSDRVDNR